MKSEMRDHSCFGEWFDSSDLLNQLLVILVGAALLLVNIGWMDASVLAYWPVILLIIGIRALMHGRN